MALLTSSSSASSRAASSRHLLRMRVWNSTASCVDRKTIILRFFVVYYNEIRTCTNTEPTLERTRRSRSQPHFGFPQNERCKGDQTQLRRNDNHVVLERVWSCENLFRLQATVTENVLQAEQRTTLFREFETYGTCTCTNRIK